MHEAVCVLPVILFQTFFVCASTKARENSNNNNLHLRLSVKRKIVLSC